MITNLDIKMPWVECIFLNSNASSECVCFEYREWFVYIHDNLFPMSRGVKGGSGKGERASFSK